MVKSPTIAVPLEDEVGDVLDKAMHHLGLTDESLAALAGVQAGRILDAVDYRSDLTRDELSRLARVLGLNDVGLQALASGRYPLPAIGPLPFCVWPLRMPHGIGVVNAYLVGDCGSGHAILFDAGARTDALCAAWPRNVHSLDAVYVTHVEPEHVGGLSDILERFSLRAAYVPLEAKIPFGLTVGEGGVFTFGALEVTVFSTPGHAEGHNCYLVRAPSARRGRDLLISGDLVFAGSAGAGYFSYEKQRANLRRVLGALSAETLIAPGHGPLTTVGNELQYNPFLP